MAFEAIDVNTLKINPFTMLHEQWALVSAGDAEKHNTMTISWGGMGIMWHKPIANVYLRPQRYTKEFVDSLDLFTVSFFPESRKKALGLLGSKSGRDGDKITESGLTPWFTDGTTAFQEAETVFVCKKLFGGQQLDPAKFTETGLDSEFYPGKDYHYLYFGEILKVYVQK